VVLGAPVFTYPGHADGPFLAEGTELFQLGDDPGAAARAPVGRAVLTTLRAGVDAVLAGLDPGDRPAPTGRPLPPEPPAADPITAAHAIHTLARLLSPDVVVVEEAPSHRNAIHDHLPIRRAGGFFAAASGGLGWALPAAVGIALAEPARPVAALLGDGSSLYSIQALWTAAQLRLPITFVVLDNHGYAALKSLGLAMGMERPPGVDLPGLRLTDLATGFGCDAIAVEKAEQLESALRSALGAREPTVIVVTVDPSIRLLY
jgi:benzoylformate decarboxylase